VMRELDRLSETETGEPTAFDNCTRHVACWEGFNTEGVHWSDVGIGGVVNVSAWVRLVPFQEAVRVAVASAEIVPAVPAMVADTWPVAIVAETGTVTKALFLAMVTVVFERAAPDNETVQLNAAPDDRIVGVQTKD
jgi:hypothetical protein